MHRFKKRMVAASAHPQAGSNPYGRVLRRQWLASSLLRCDRSMKHLFAESKRREREVLG